MADHVANDWRREREQENATNFHEYQAAAAVVLTISLLGMFIRLVVGPNLIALIYLLGVVLTAMFVGRGPTLLGAVMSAVFWDFCFLEPIGNLHIVLREEGFMFGGYLLVAIFLGQLTARLRAQERHERLREQRSTTLYQLTGKLAEDTNLEQMLKNAVKQTETVFAAGIALLLTDSAGRLKHHVHPASTYDITGPEQSVADWVFENARQAGVFTNKFAHVDTLFVPLKADGRTLGVMGLNFKDASGLTIEQNSLLEMFCQHIARALDRHWPGAESGEPASYGPNPGRGVRCCST